MDKDRVEGSWEQAKGKVKEVAGKATGASGVAPLMQPELASRDRAQHDLQPVVDQKVRDYQKSEGNERREHSGHQLEAPARHSIWRASRPARPG